MKRQKFTLIETLLSVGMLSLILGISLSTIISAQQAYRQSLIHGDAERQGIEFADKVVSKLERARLTDSTISNIHNNSYPYIEFQVPVVPPGLDSSINDTTDPPEIRWGAYANGVGYEGDLYTYRIFPDTSNADYLYESQLQYDMNRDGDTADGFILCSCAMTVNYGETVLERISLCPKIYIGEMFNNNDETSNQIPVNDIGGEPTFQLQNNDRELHMNFWICKTTGDGEIPYLYEISRVVGLENMGN